MKINIKKIITIFILTITLAGCTSNLQKEIKLSKKNDHYISTYDLEKTNINLYQLNFEQVMDYENFINNEKYIMIFIRDSCPNSKKLFQNFIKEINTKKYSIKDLFIFEVDDYITTDEDTTNSNRENFQKKFDIQSVPVTFLIKDKKIFAMEIGYYDDTILKEILLELENK